MMAASSQKGKFRPRLQQLIGSNSEDAVQSSTSKAFGLLPDVQAAITELCKLKGVGPATASGTHTYQIMHACSNCNNTHLNSIKLSLSAVLAAGAPGEVAFMADEAVESIAELRPVEYTAKHYALFLQKMLHKSSQLNKGKTHVKLKYFFITILLYYLFPVSVDSQQDWTPHRVEQCLWAWAVANQIQPSLIQEFNLMDATNTVTNQKPEKRKTADEKPSKRLKTTRS